MSFRFQGTCPEPIEGTCPELVEGGSRYALRNVNLEIAAGDFVVLTGPSGCGKSTLALAIGGYLFRQYEGETTGEVIVGGIDVRQAPIYDVAEIVGLIQQDPEAQFCTLTVQDEVAFGLENRCLPREQIQQRINWALEIVGAQYLFQRPLASLSGGEKQKVAIAAVMASKPSVLIFDEPTSNLDPSATAEVFDVISHIRETVGITVIVIEHKVGYLQPFAPRLLAMEAGRIVYDGPMMENGQLCSYATMHVGKNGLCDAPEIEEDEDEPRVRVAGLYVGYDGKPVLKDISLDIGRGEFVAVMGDNGSGKTTFLRSLLGLLKPDQGRVEVLGCDTRHTPISQLAQRVGFVFQNPNHQLFADSVWKEAIFAPQNFGMLDDAAQAQAAELLERSGLGGRYHDHPYRLSYGEKRRLTLISVLTYAPQLILLDEVLIGQDAQNAAFLLALLCERVRQGSSVIMINHNLEVSRRYASRLIFFEQGRVVVDAPPAEGFKQLAKLGKRAYCVN